MTHPVFEAQLDAYLDGELDAADARALEAHVAQCATCARLRDEQLALRDAIAAHIPSFQAPDTLRRRIRTTVEASERKDTTGRIANPGWSRALAIAASLAIVSLGSWRLALQGAASQALTDDVLSSHVRSLMPGHSTDVLSTDQHTVKPWFNGKLDFSPPVYDFASSGYPLIGGRLDYVDRHPVAALVYGRRQHLINVFLWPAARGANDPPSSHSGQGYHLLHWTTADYTYWAVSDLGLPELEDFVGMVKRADAASAARD